MAGPSFPGGLPWNGAGPALRKRFGRPFRRIGLDAGFSCPNRDGTVARGGCRFCDAGGARAAYVEPEKPVAHQLADGMAHCASRRPEAQAYIAYYQAFSNTHGSLAQVQNALTPALEHPDVAAIAIGTRPDCISLDILAFLEDVAPKRFLWLEMGLQTADDTLLAAMNRGHDGACFLKAAHQIQGRRIPLVVHVMLGLPGETAEVRQATLEMVNGVAPWGIKIHNLYIDKESPLYADWQAGRVHPPEKEEYQAMLTDFLAGLNPDILIHRLVGEAPGERLAAPLWPRKKNRFLQELEKGMKEAGLYQGCRFQSP